MKHVAGFLGLAAVVMLFLVYAQSASAEIIVLNESKEQVYAVGSVLVSGDLKESSLRLSGSGEVILGENVKVYLFGPSSDVLVSDVMVNGVATAVSFDKNGYFFVVPATGKFTFTGDLKIRTIGQIRLYVRGPLNELRFNLKNGYALNGDEYGLYEKEVIIQRSDKAAMLVDGSFRYTYAERDEFLYQLNLQSFGSSLGRYVLDLNNNEQVISVTGALKWEQSGSKLLLDLEGSKASVSVRGLFSSAELRIPLREDKHHVLIESDPEKKISINTYAKEIDLSESPLSAQYSNARAFLASGSDVFHVTVKKLDLLPSLAASVSHATNDIAVTGKGSILGELTYRYANTGMDYVEIDTPGIPLYASTGGGAVKLTKDNKLLLSFPKTSYGNLDLVYFNTTDALSTIGISMIDVPTAKTDIPITQATTTIYLPEDQFVIKTFGAKGGSELPSLSSIVIFVVVFGILGGLVRRDAGFVASYMAFTYVLMNFEVSLFLLWTAGTIALIVKKRMEGASAVKLAVAGVAVFIVLAILLVVPFILIWQLGVFNMGSTSYAPREYEADYATIQRAEMPVMKSMSIVGSGEGAITVPTRTGVLPVKLELPRMAKSITVTNELVTKENQVELKLLLVSTNLKYLAYLLAIGALTVCVRRYEENPKAK
jgi:hypothetical protein